mmetsp:Transcript_23318/g.58465  ORF Transcript_23318/g.58465 Transcript_23318/m.58465 type:complete len:244 (+) Transcript_23318:875-1606(+)
MLLDARGGQWRLSRRTGGGRCRCRRGGTAAIARLWLGPTPRGEASTTSTPPFTTRSSPSSRSTARSTRAWTCMPTTRMRMKTSTTPSSGTTRQRASRLSRRTRTLPSSCSNSRVTSTTAGGPRSRSSMTRRTCSWRTPTLSSSPTSWSTSSASYSCFIYCSSAVPSTTPSARGTRPGAGCTGSPCTSSRRTSSSSSRPSFSSRAANPARRPPRCSRTSTKTKRDGTVIRKFGFWPLFYFEGCH